MRKLLLILILLPSGLCMSQPTTQTSGQLFFEVENEKQKLQQFIDHISSKRGIFQRVIQKIDVDITATYSQHHRFSPYLELNYIHLRFFDFGKEIRIDEKGTPFAIGKVFMSERYVETDYFDSFRKPDDYLHDRDGFFYYCKVYFDTKNLEQRIIIYPRYLVNICDKYMHLNRKCCIANDIEAHDNTIRLLIAIQDTDYDDFISENSFVPLKQRKESARKELFEFAQKNSGVRINVHKLFKQEVRSPNKIKNFYPFFTHQIRKNTLPVFVNYAKYMKVFRITPADTFGSYEGTKLTLTYSKRPNNEDFTDNLAYDFTFQAYTNKPLSDTLSDYVEYTRNPGNRRLVYSEKPDDEFITGKKRVFNPISFDTQNLQGVDSCRNSSDGFLTCLDQLHEKTVSELITMSGPINSAKYELEVAKMNQQAFIEVNGALANQKPEFPKIKQEAELAYKKVTEKDSIRASLTGLLLRIEQEMAKAEKDLSNLAGFVFVQNSLAQYFTKLDTTNETEKMKFFFNLFQRPFYIRYTLPEKISEVHYQKSEIREKYEPFNLNRTESRKYFQTKINKGEKWKTYRESSYQKLLGDIKINTSVTSPKMALYKGTPDEISIIEIAGNNGIKYQWLYLPNKLIKEIPYINHFMNRHPKRGNIAFRPKLSWKELY